MNAKAKHNDGRAAERVSWRDTHIGRWSKDGILAEANAISRPNWWKGRDAAEREALSFLQRKAADQVAKDAASEEPVPGGFVPEPDETINNYLGRMRMVLPNHLWHALKGHCSNFASGAKASHLDKTMLDVIRRAT